MSAEPVTGAIEEPILRRLKDETKARHHALEARVDLHSRLRTPADYRELLETFYGVYCPLELEIAKIDLGELAKWLPDIQDRMRTAALRRDLRVLGNNSPEALPVAPVPGLHSLAEELGCLYVLEGSTLGGQFISRRIATHLGFTRENGCTFFSGHGAETGARWNQFRNAMQTYATAHPTESESIVQTAIRIFDVFAAWIEKRL